MRCGQGANGASSAKAVSTAIEVAALATAAGDLASANQEKISSQLDEYISLRLSGLEKKVSIRRIHVWVYALGVILYSSYRVATCTSLWSRR